MTAILKQLMPSQIWDRLAATASTSTKSLSKHLRSVTKDGGAVRNRRSLDVDEERLFSW